CTWSGSCPRARCGRTWTCSPGTTASAPAARSAARPRACARRGRCCRHATAAEAGMGRGTVPRTFFAIALLLAMLAPACSSLETRIAEPRSGSLLGDGDLEKMEAALGIERGALQLSDGPRLVYRSVEPRAYGAR